MVMAGAALQGRGDADGGLRCAGAHGHDGQANDQLGDAEPVCNAGRALHKPVCAFDQHGKAQNQQNTLQQEIHCFFLPLYYVRKSATKKRDLFVAVSLQQKSRCFVADRILRLTGGKSD